MSLLRLRMLVSAGLLPLVRVGRALSLIRSLFVVPSEYYAMLCINSRLCQPLVHSNIKTCQPHVPRAPSEAISPTLPSLTFPLLFFRLPLSFLKDQDEQDHEIVNSYFEGEEFMQVHDESGRMGRGGRKGRDGGIFYYVLG